MAPQEKHYKFGKNTWERAEYIGSFQLFNHLKIATYSKK